MAYLYRHIRLDKNVPFYVGVGNDTRNYRRANDSVLRNKLWKNIVSKTSFEVEIVLDDIPYEEVLKKEIEFISLYGRVDLKTGTLVNLTEGGDGAKGFTHSEETKVKRSNDIKGEKHPMFGKRHSEKTIVKMRDAKIGKKHHPDTITKIVTFHIGRKRTAETCQKLKNAAKLIPVLKYDLHGNFIQEYNSILDAATLNNGDSSNISSCCNGINKSSINFIWRHKINNYIPKNIHGIVAAPNDKKSVLQYDLQGVLINEFDTITFAAKATNSNINSIISCCKNKTKTANKFIWKYKE